LNSFTYLSVFALIFALSTFSIPDAHAIFVIISDETSCESISDAIWSSVSNVCTITTDQIFTGDEWVINHGITLFIEPDVTITVKQGSISIQGQMENNGTIIGFGTIANEGTITNNFSGIINIRGIQNFDIIRNYGTIDAFGKFNNSGVLDNFGNIVVSGFAVGPISNLGLISNSGTIIIKNFGDTFTVAILNWAEINNIGVITISNSGGAGIQNSGNFLNNGIINISNTGGIGFNNIANLTNSGTINNQCSSIYSGNLPIGNPINEICNNGGGSTQFPPPTLGLDENQKRIVDDGFSFNGNSVDVEQFFTPYPLITTEIGKPNIIKLKIYENEGIDNIAHVGLSYGLGKNEIFNEGRAIIEYDRTFDGIESVTLFDPKNVLGSVNVTANTTNCSAFGNTECLEVTFDHIFRTPLEYDMVATNIWDFERSGWQNYFNHGIHIVGESMNPPEEYSGIYKGHIYHLIETGKNIAIDDEGNHWMFDKTWTRDYIKPVSVDHDILNPEKIYAIEKLGFQHSDGNKIFGFERVDQRFAETKNQQDMISHDVISELCPKCQEKSFEEINDIFFYDLPDRSHKLENPEIIKQLNLEDKKARQFLQEYFKKIYHKVND
jgi:hypothetical protein